jgi:dienelactone hydrolase
MDERITLSGLYRDNSTLFISRIKAAIDAVKSLSEVDNEKVAVIGYCFGGTFVCAFKVRASKRDSNIVLVGSCL